MKTVTNTIQIPATVIDYSSSSFWVYITSVIHAWLKTLSLTGAILVPLFVILDYFLAPEGLLGQFVLYRALATGFILAQYLVIRFTKPGRASYLHGYLFAFVVGLTVSQMTVDLGGFNSSYYAGLNLVIIATNILLPWRAIHSTLTSLLIIALYLLLNVLTPQPFLTANFINNFSFLVVTAVLAISINHVKYLLLRQEYELRAQILETNNRLAQSEGELKVARDSLWGEIELAKEIQTALLPQDYQTDQHQIAASMLPASQVGGDYFDVKAGSDGSTWFNIGDVSGHGVTSGLIMMMAQTSIASMIQGIDKIDPSEVIRHVNVVVSENIRRLNEFKYMTLTLLRAKPGGWFTYSGMHQDLLIYRSREAKVVELETHGTWIGVVSDMSVPAALVEEEFKLDSGDVLLLYTDGVTEAHNAEGDMFGNARLVETLGRFGHLAAIEIKEKILAEVLAFSAVQDDDITLLVVKQK